MDGSSSSGSGSGFSLGAGSKSAESSKLAWYANIVDHLSEKPTWSASNETAVLEPFSYITSNPGKEIRARMIDAFNVWLRVPNEELAVISGVLRRGMPVAHKIYGIPQTINSGNYVYFLAYRELLKLRTMLSESGKGKSPHPLGDLDQVVTEELLNLHRGQGLDLLWRDHLHCPTEEEYVDMVNNKTGGLFRLAIKLMMICASENRDVNYVPLVNLIGVYFQIRDDYANLQSAEYTTNKGFAEDLTEGKFSFPIVHAVRADTSNRQVLNVLQKRPSTPTLKIHTIQYLDKHTKSFEYTRKVLRSLEEQTRGMIGELGGNEKLEGIMDALRVREP